MVTINIEDYTPEEIIKIMDENKVTNIQTPTSYITLTGGFKEGILTKWEKGKHFASIKGKWVKIN